MNASDACKTVLVIGTYDTKADELTFLCDCIHAQGGQVLTMDVSVLGDAAMAVAITKHQVAAQADCTIDQVIASGDENSAMQLMSRGATALATQLHRRGEFDAMIALGGSMGTDLALDVALALPMGVPKYIVSTIAFSALLAPQRLAPDIQMILWAGGLYGLNAICRSSLSQAAGAVLGAARAAQPPASQRPLVGMTSLGKSCLSYMVDLKPALEQRGFDVAVFHATGMGGRAFEGLAAQGAFAAVMDFCPQELGNYLLGSVVNAGSDRLTNAGAAGIPQLIAPGCTDLVDLPAWQPLPEIYHGRPFHAHNRLIASAALTAQERRMLARAMASRLAVAQAPVHVILPLQGIEEWDRAGQPAHDPQGLQAFMEEAQQVFQAPIAQTVIDAHINDAQFVQTALDIFDQWVADGVIPASA